MSSLEYQTEVQTTLYAVCSPFFCVHVSEPLDFESADIYCSADFTLSNPETFNRVIPLYRRRLCPNLTEIFTQQSDQLSQHLDVVELAIVNHVGFACLSQFFSLFRTILPNEVRLPARGAHFPFFHAGVRAVSSPFRGRARTRRGKR